MTSTTHHLRRLADSADLWSGFLFAAFGLFFVLTARNYQLGSAEAMGPGYFPTALGGLLILFGVVLMGRGLAESGEPIEPLTARYVLVVLGAILAFAVLLEHAGLVASGLLLVVISSFATPGIRPARLIIFALLLVFSTALLFVVLLGVQIPLAPSFLAN